MPDADLRAILAASGLSDVQDDVQPVSGNDRPTEAK
jgi:hypothetical protein